MKPAHALTAAILVSALVTASPAAAQGAACDRACLLSTADAYLAALVAQDASKAPMASSAKFTEQARVMKVGDEGLWKSALSTSTTFRIPVADPVSGQIGMIVMMKEEGDKDIQLALRLKVVDRKITEAEITTR